MTEIIASTYEVIERIGSGGGGVVYLANHIRLNKKVVLKVDKRRLTTRPEILRREVDALKNLSHTYIPQVYDFFVEGETVYTVMDYIEGESLDKPLKRGIRFSQPEVINWAIELLEALSYLHSPIHGDPPRGIVHSDIKPANIMLTPHGHICLIDLNIALALGEENVVGRSAGYASPEHYGLDFSDDTPMVDDSTEVMTDTEATIPMSRSEYSSSIKKIVVPDVRSDIYSLGATLYHLLSGVKPAKNALDVEPLSEKEFSPQIVKIISRAMNPNPNLRYQSADEMLYAITHLHENDPRTKRRKKIFVSVTSILAFFILAGAFTAFTGLKRMEGEQRALTLSEYSHNALEEGDPVSAVQYALESLNMNRNLFTPPRAPQSEKALADALGVYDLADGYKSHHVIKLPSEALKTVLSPNGKTGIAVYAFAAQIFDTETGEIKGELPLVKSALSDVVFIDDKTLVYAGENGISVYDTETEKNLWSGKPATQIAVSADKKTIAGVYRDEAFATLYGIDGKEKGMVDFAGKKQKVLQNDTFADPEDNILSLSADGKYMAVSFSDGGLIIYDTTNAQNSIELYDTSDYTHFEGGFYGRYFAFSSTKYGSSVFAVINTEELVQEGGFELDSRIGVKADETGIYLSNKSTVVKIDPVSGEQTEVAYSDSDVRQFETDTLNTFNTVVATEKNECVFYDKSADLISTLGGGQTDCSLVSIAGEYALLAGIDSPVVRIIKKDMHSDADLFTYDASYPHDEARISSDKNTLMFFDYQNIRLYNKDGKVIKDIKIPDAENVYDQQYSKKSGNLAVMYKDALRIYSGKTGDIVTEKTNLKSVFYAPYGVSILNNDATVSLIDIDTGEEILNEKTDGNYAAYCGMVVNDDFLNGGELIGASKHGDGYLFAVANEDICTLYDGDGNKLFEVPVAEQSEAFFTDSSVILSPLHGTPTAYNLSDGSKKNDLEKDSYLTYIYQLDNGCVMSEYISSGGERYAILLDGERYEPIARLPCMTDLSDGCAVFDYHKGKLRQTRIYSIEELIEIAKGGDAK